MIAKRGIDISSWQGVIDFKKVKESGVEFIIVRYADGASIDRLFNHNMQNCQDYGFHFGAYIYSRAINEAQAKGEAQRIIEACKPYKYDMPLYIDLEVDKNKSIANQIAGAFLAECDRQGVKGGIYANKNWFTNYIDTERFKKYPLWIAQWGKSITHRTPGIFGMWQYSDSGYCPGISGKVDLDKCYNYYWIDQNNPEPDDKIKAMALDVLLGKYGNGIERRKKLGSNYNSVQELVNKVVKLFNK